MESEKVKEIKKALECCSKGECGVWCPRFDKKNINHTCQDDMNADALILINELESENEKFKNFMQHNDWGSIEDMETTLDKAQQKCFEVAKENQQLKDENERLLEQRNKTYNIWVKDTEKLKNRIAELKKELTNDRVFYKDGICYPMNCQGALKQFAERLKEKLKARHEVNSLLLMPVRDVVLSTIEGLLEDVDKTLKELINE